MSDFKAKTNKNDFGWGSAPDPARGVYSAPPDLLAEFEGPCFSGKGEEGRKREGEEGREKKRDDLPYDLGDLEMTWLL